MGGWEVGGSFKRERIYVYLWLINVVACHKPQHNIVNQLSSN